MSSLCLPSPEICAGRPDSTRDLPRCPPSSRSEGPGWGCHATRSAATYLDELERITTWPAWPRRHAAMTYDPTRCCAARQRATRRHATRRHARRRRAERQGAADLASGSGLAGVVRDPTNWRDELARRMTRQVVNRTCACSALSCVQMRAAIFAQPPCNVCATHLLEADHVLVALKLQPCSRLPIRVRVPVPAL